MQCYYSAALIAYFADDSSIATSLLQDGCLAQLLDTYGHCPYDHSKLQLHRKSHCGTAGIFHFQCTCQHTTHYFKWSTQFKGSFGTKICDYVLNPLVVASEFMSIKVGTSRPATRHVKRDNKTLRVCHPAVPCRARTRSTSAGCSSGS